MAYDITSLERFDAQVDHGHDEAIEGAIAEIKRLRAALKDIAKRDGRAAHHVMCYNCVDSSNEALAVLA